ncbi:MAG: hypothetical protein ABH885_06950 [Candidatus Omnitrophota bacterium]
MRAYICNLLDSLAAAPAPEKAIEYANRCHEKAWGAGTVARGPLPAGPGERNI